MPGRTARKITMIPQGSVVKMSSFSIDFEAEMPYLLAPPQGREEDSDL
jgi:hypothetical protein